MWELDINPYYSDVDERRPRKLKWRMVVPPKKHRLSPRIWHSGVLIGQRSQSKYPQAVLFYGGMSRSPDENNFVNTLLRLKVSPPSLLSLALNALISSQKSHCSLRNRDLQAAIPVSLAEHLYVLELVRRCAKQSAGERSSRLNLLDAEGPEVRRSGRGADVSEFRKLSQGKHLLYTLFNAFDL